VSVVGPIQQYNASLPRLLAWSPENDHTLTRSYLSEQPFSIEPRIKEIALDSGAHYFSLIDYFCKNNACAELAKSNVPLQIDYGHLSAEGSSLVAGSLLRSVSLSGPEKKYLQSAQ
jgi:hypothetical protein